MGVNVFGKKKVYWKGELLFVIQFHAVIFVIFFLFFEFSIYLKYPLVHATSPNKKDNNKMMMTTTTTMNI